MRWFKHLSLASEDEKLSEIIELYGAEGYGIYWIILEKIAFLMDGTEKTSARYSVKKWSKFCGKSPKVFRKFLESFEKLNLLKSITIDENNEKFSINNGIFLEIDCPNLLKYRDEYSKKSRQTPDKLQKDSGQTPDQETETETETELKKNEFSDDEEKPKKHSKKKSGEIEKPENVSEQTWEDFISHRKDKKAKITKTALNGIINQAKKAGWELEDALIELVTRGWTGFKSDWVTKKTSTKTTSDKMARMRKQTQELLHG
jgi:hypothetical protein